MLRLLLGTLTIFATHLVLATAFVGIGLSLRRAAGFVRADLEDCFFAFWIGFSASIVFLMLWNFAFPANPVSLAIVLVLGVGGFIAVCLTRTLKPSTRRLGGWAVVAILLAGVWIANQSSGAMTEWDTSLYHMQGVKWARAHRVLPGLANVFGPMGFNNSSFLYDAMLDAGPWSGHSWHIANGLLLSAMAAQAIAGGAWFLAESDVEARAGYLFQFLTLAFVLNATLRHASTFATSVPVALLLMVATSRWYLTLVRQSDDVREEAYNRCCIVALVSVATSVKSSAAAFAAATTICVWVFRPLPPGLFRRMAIAWSLAGAAFTGTLWIARGILLSGYPLFPSPVLALPVDWRVPFEHARAEFDFVVLSGREAPDVLLSNHAPGAWVPHWLATLFVQPYEVVAPAILSAAAAIAYVWLSRRRPVLDSTVRADWWLSLPLGLAIVSWLATAPMPRYAAPFFWSIAALCASQAFRVSNAGRRLVQGVFVAAALVGSSPLILSPVWTSFVTRSSDRPIASIVSANLKLPDTGRLYQFGTIAPQLVEYVTQSGLTLNVPTGSFGRCWDAPLPCTPNPAPNLRLRVPGDFESGFAVDGPWQMLHWPETWRPELLPALRESWAAQDGK